MEIEKFEIKTPFGKLIIDLLLSTVMKNGVKKQYAIIS